MVSDAVGLLSVNGIGHKIKSVELVKEYFVMDFLSYSLLGYALAMGLPPRRRILYVAFYSLILLFLFRRFVC